MTGFRRRLVRGEDREWMAQSERDRLLERLKRVKSLADRGTGGERDNAATLLTTLMEKHNITEADLEDAKVSTYWFRYQTSYERKLLFQLSYMHLGSGHAVGCVGAYSGRRRKEVGIKCTPAQYIEIEADYQFYRSALEEELEVFYSAFVQKNELFPPPELAGSRDVTELTDPDTILKMEAMMEGIEHRTRSKAIGDGSCVK